MRISKRFAGVLGIAALLAALTTGCATRRYVRNRVGPVDQRVDAVDKKHTENTAKLEEKTDLAISRVDERAMGAEGKAMEAAKAAQAAGQAAEGARQLAAQNQTQIGEVKNQVGTLEKNIDNYRLVGTEQILFGFDKARLTPESKAVLDKLVSGAADKGKYVFEVQGFTDKVGAPDYNLTLSRRRADTVVRYLVNQGIPLRLVHMLGLGSEVPAADVQPVNTDHAAARKLMRRVVVRVWAPETLLAANPKP